MALANVAALLAQMGRRVLVVDFDLEAPGLHRYFEQRGVRLDMPSASRGGGGLVEMFDAQRRGKSLDWRRCVAKIRWSAATYGVDLILAGGGSSDYAELVQSLNWDELFRRHEFGDYLCRLREEWRNEYDIVLVDSRTGMSDIGGICTILLPDALVMLFTANEQSIDGTAEVVRRARTAQETLPVERGRMLAVPMLSRDDRRTEYEQSEEWRLKIADAMKDFFSDWVWAGVTSEAVLQKLYLPQIAYWSFGERMPVIERPRELEDPSSLGAAYRRLARLIDGDFNWKVIETEEAVPDKRSILLEEETGRLQRQMRRLIAVTLASLMAVLAMAGLLVFQLQRERERQQQQQEQQRKEAFAREAAMQAESRRQQQQLREAVERLNDTSRQRGGARP